MKLIYMVAIASIVGSTLTAGVTKLIKPAETKTAHQILFEAYVSNPAGTASHVEAAVAACVPEAAEVRSVNAPKIITKIFIYVYDSLREFPKDRERSKAKFRRQVEQKITPLIKAASLEDQKLLVLLANKTASEQIRDCIAARSNFSLQNPDATAKPLFSDTQLRGL